MGVLPGTKYIEIPQGYGLQAEQGREYVAIVLTRKF